MPESLDAYAALDQVRRELVRLNARVDAVDGKVEQLRVNQLAMLAVTLARGTEVPAEVTLRVADMSYEAIGRLVGKSPAAVRMIVQRYNKRASVAPNKN